MIRAAYRKPNGCVQLMYGEPLEDGSFREENGRIHPSGTWFRSRQANCDKDENDEDE